jgi:hypothetical protein
VTAGAGRGTCLSLAGVCSTDIAAPAFGAATVVAAFAKAEEIATRPSKTMISAERALSGSMNKVSELIKKCLKHMASPTIRA